MYIYTYIIYYIPYTIYHILFYIIYHILRILHTSYLFPYTMYQLYVVFWGRTEASQARRALRLGKHRGGRVECPAIIGVIQNTDYKGQDFKMPTIRAIAYTTNHKGL